MRNAEIARLFREISAFLDMEGVQFKPRAYEKAADSIDALGDPVEEIHAAGGAKALAKIPGVGKSFAEKIAELLETGKIALHEELRQKTPVDVSELLRLDGLGPKGIKTLYAELRVCSVADLEAALAAGRVRHLPRFGEKMEQKLRQSLAFLRAETGRLPIGRALPAALEIEAALRGVRGVAEVAIAGSLRRRKETIGDLDFLVVSADPAPVMEAFTTSPDVVVVHGRGPTKSSVRLSIGIDADLRVVPAESFGAALQYFTGAKDHGVACRKIAIERGLKLNEYGVFRGDERIAGRTEEDVYEALGLPWIPPELREDRGEVQAALRGRLPDLLPYASLRGDLQTQTNWTDGADTIEAMAAAAKAAGLEYIAVTDHTKSLAMARGCDEEKLRRQMREIDALNRKLDGFRVLKGSEVDIRRDGTLDLADDCLAELDVVGIAVHSHFDLAKREMTDRICRAMRNPHADVLFHPTCRKIGQRPPIEVDIDEVIRVAVETGTALEIDSFPDRLDLSDEHVRKAVAAGAKITIDSDAHATSHFRVLDYGVAVARRAWVEKRSVLNALSAEEMLARLKS